MSDRRTDRGAGQHRTDDARGVPQRDRVSVGLRVLVAVGLAYDAYAHLDLAGSYDASRGAWLSQGALFRVEAAVAIVALLLVLLVRARWAALPAFVVAASAAAAALLFRYVDVGALAGLPDMYEPVWFTEKALSVVAEVVAALAAVAVGFRRTTTPAK